MILEEINTKIDEASAVNTFLSDCLTANQPGSMKEDALYMADSELNEASDKETNEQEFRDGEDLTKQA